MSEKRFRITTNPKSQSVAFDEKQKKHYIGAELEDLLNELAEENEQLRKELDNFKPVMFQDMRKGTIILYSKG